MSEHKAIFKSASVISIFTIISRITGFLRDVLIARIFGTGISAQAFFVSFRIPNMLRDVIGEGAGNAAFVPVFCEYQTKKSHQEFLRLVNTLLLLLIGFSLIMTLAGILCSPVLVRLMAPGFFEDHTKFELTVRLTRLLFPYLILITISAYLMSVYNALKSFAMPASASIVFNLVLILALFIIGRTMGAHQIFALSIAVLIAGISQILIQLPLLFKKGINFKSGGIYPNFFKEAAIRKVGRLILPRIVGTSIYQLNIFVDTIFASLAFFVGEGAIAAIYYANRIIQLPFSIFGVALSNAALPTMSLDSAHQDLDSFKATLAFSLKTVFLGIIPVMMGILVFATPLVRVIFQRGSFDVYSTAITSRAVFFYAFGLVFYVGVRVLSLAFYALQDTRTPVKTSALALLLNILLNALFIFVFKFRISGLALASSVSAMANFYLLCRLMNSKTGFSFGPAMGWTVFKATASAIAMAVLVFFIWQRFFSAHPSFFKMCFIAFLGGIIYVAFLWLFKVKEFKELLFWLQKRK